MANILYDLYTIAFPKWFKVVYSMQQDNLMSSPSISPSPQQQQQKLVYQAAGMLITKVSLEFGSELPDSQGKIRSLLVSHSSSNQQTYKFI